MMLKIGRIAGSHGLKGSVILVHELEDTEWMKLELPIFLELNSGSFIPFFVEEFKPLNASEFIVRFDDTPTLEAAKKLTGKIAYVEAGKVKIQTENSPRLWLGFTINTDDNQTLGTIAEVIENGPQWLAKLFIGQQEVLVPLVPEFIKKINERLREIVMDLPEGLLEVYLTKE